MLRFEWNAFRAGVSLRMAWSCNQCSGRVPDLSIVCVKLDLKPRSLARAGPRRPPSNGFTPRRVRGLHHRSLATPDGLALFEKSPYTFAGVVAGADFVAEFVEVLVFDLERIADYPRDHLLHRAH
jgi:hypothetical protein